MRVLFEPSENPLSQKIPTPEIKNAIFPAYILHVFFIRTSYFWLGLSCSYF